MNADGSNVTRLTSPPGRSMHPVFTSDGSRILFASNRGGKDQIYVMNADGSNVTPMTTIPEEGVDFVLSPDGRKIAFTSKYGGKSQIYLMDADGSHLTRLTSPPGQSAIPGFSRDGTKIAFSSDRDGPVQIYVMGVDGSNVTRLTNSPEPDHNPMFGPPGPLPPPSSPLLHPAAICTVDPTITPGGGISRLRLGMSLADVRQFLAAPPHPVQRGTSGDSTWEGLTYYPAGGLTFVARDDHLVYITLGFTEEASVCATRDGIRVNGSTAAVKAAYGNPEGALSLPRTNVTYWVYNKRGVELQVNTQGQVLLLGVFPPGTYCRLQEPLSGFGWRHPSGWDWAGLPCKAFAPPLS